MARYRHIIWDWNGTLLDDVDLCIDVINAMLRGRNLAEVDCSRYREIFDFPVIGYYRALGFDFDAESFEDLAHLYCDAYDNRVSECSLHADVATVLDRLSQSGSTQSILSSCEQAALHDAINRFGLAQQFAAVVGQSDRYAVGKEAAGRALLAGSQIPASQTLLIGDTLHDHEVARVLGIDCILVANGHHSRQRLEVVGDPVVDTLEQVIAHAIG